MTSSSTPKVISPSKIDVVICSGDFISGVTSWAFRLRRAFNNHPRFRIHVLNCLNTRETVGRFEAITPEPKSFEDYLKSLDAPIVIPNYFWKLFDSCRKIRADGFPLQVIGYCRSDSKEEYYEPLTQIADLLSHIVAVSPECASHLKGYSPKLARIPTTVLPTGIDVPQTLVRTWQATPLRIAYGGRIEQKQKRVDDLIPLVDELYRLDIDFTLSIAGAGRPLKALEEQLKFKDKDQRIQIHGKLLPENMPKFWMNHDLMLSLSEYEGTSNSMLEAMAAGCIPIVSQTQSGTKGIINSGNNGFTFPIGDISKLAVLIGKMNTSSLPELGFAAHTKASEFSIEKHAQTFGRILSSCIA